jgi:hypothetical protein
MFFKNLYLTKKNGLIVVMCMMNENYEDDDDDDKVYFTTQRLGGPRGGLDILYLLQISSNFEVHLFIFVFL